MEAHSLNTKVHKTIVPTYERLYKEDSGFGVYTVEDENANTFCIRGTFISPLVIGQTYGLDGLICQYKGEKQINVQNIQNVKPINKKGIISYLQTLKGLKTRAFLIYDKFGAKSIEALMEDPLAVASSIKGIGDKMVLDWQEQLEKMKESQYAMSCLLGYGLTNKQAKKLYDTYGDAIIGKIEENPYFLSYEVRGYGFERCDRIARNIGHDPKSKFRIQEGLINVLEKASFAGNCFLPQNEFIVDAIKLLTVSLSYQEMIKFSAEQSGKADFEYAIGQYKYKVNYNKMIECLSLYKKEVKKAKKAEYRYVVVPFIGEEILEQLAEVQNQRRIIVEGDKIYLKELYDDECKVAERICLLSEEIPFRRNINLEEELDNFLKEGHVILEEKQRQAVLTFASKRGGIAVLTGPAGSGKTYTVKRVLELLKKQYDFNDKSFSVQVFAPTGKAAKVASRATGMECMTVHRGLSYNPLVGFLYNEDNPLEADCIVIDESSMLDITLTKHLLNAINNGTKVIFLGDTNQLPSIGAGNVLHDLMQSNIIKVVTLDVIKRQDGLSGIVKNANQIIKGNMISSCEDTKDAYVIFRKGLDAVQKVIIDSVHRLLENETFTFEDIQILCPQKNGLVGTYYLNYLLQKEFNPIDEGYKVLARTFQIQSSFEGKTETINLFFRKNDKVIHIKNNYDMEWYSKDVNLGYVLDKTIVGITNGECGTIEEIDKIKVDGKEKFRIIVKYENGYVFYDDGFDELEHAYALTIHKSQGSQWKAVIIPLVTQHYSMLDNNLFYTAYTRAESFVVTVGQPEAFRLAIKTHKTRNRHTGLVNKIINLTL